MKKSTGKPVSADGEDALPREIGRPATHALALIGIARLTQLAEMTEEEVLSLHGVGPKAVSVLRTALQNSGRSFRAP